jgi:RNA polymerase-binding transcription factor
MSERKPPIDEREAGELLRRERGRIEGSPANLERLRSSELDEIDTATNQFDDGQVIEDEQVDMALATQLRAELEAVERAEQRLEEGAYGFSIESGEPIPAERLRTIPWAERTPEEQERYERTPGGRPGAGG